MTNRTCSEPGCQGRHRGRGLCNKHLLRLQRYGHTRRLRRAPFDRFMSKVTKTPGGCWVFDGTILSSGYGQFTIGRSFRDLAHRYAYTQMVGPIPDDLTVDHLCCVKACVNPEHMELVTAIENVRRRWRRQKGEM